MKSLIAVAMVLMLGGCSSKMITTYPDGTVKEEPGAIMGPSSYDLGYASGYAKLQESKASRVASVYAAPSPVDPVAKAYSDAMRVMAVVMISQERFEMKEPKTGFDVLYKLTDSVVPVAGFGALWQLGKAGIDAAGSQFGDGAVVTNGLNRTTSASTSTGANPSSTSSASGTMPASEVVKVDPFIVEIPAAVPAP